MNSLHFAASSASINDMHASCSECTLHTHACSVIPLYKYSCVMICDFSTYTCKLHHPIAYSFILWLYSANSCILGHYTAYSCRIQPTITLNSYASYAKKHYLNVFTPSPQLNCISMQNCHFNVRLILIQL